MQELTFACPGERFETSTLLQRYIAQQGAPKSALAYVDRIEARCSALGEFPNVGRQVSSAKGSLRTLPFESVMIVYRHTTQGVRVIAISTSDRIIVDS